MKAHKLFIISAAFFGLVAIIIGAIGAHGIGQNLTEQALQNLNSGLASYCEKCAHLSEQSFQRLNTGVQYQFYHVAGLLAVGILTTLHRNYSSILLKLSGTAFILGNIMFSGSLYAYAITDNELFAKITPYGGIAFILAWLFLFFYAVFKKSHSTG